ncbi:MIP/aquaporin family protein [Amycolatopsis sp. cg5]|uniref:MIP/aquaporin family protein n=1 Tax=Amycolatopsis sp. cg5 TaxID=3238802 RepID=UPI003523F874
MDYSLIRRMAAELAGTTLLCGFGIGAAVAVSVAKTGGPGLLTVALAHGLALAVAIYAFGSVSGAHCNPTVTIALASRGRFPWREVPGYVVAQIAGGVLGASLVFASYGGTAIDAGLGATTYSGNFGHALVAEALGAAILVTAVFALAVAPTAPKGLFGLGIGLALATQIMAFGPASGASVNFARTFGPDAVLSLAGGSVAWGQLLVYLIAPIVGGLVAAFVADRVGSAATVEEPEVFPAPMV